MYYNGTAKLVVGGDVKETTLDHRLIPGTSYSITVRAYQDILGPPSTPFIATTDDGNMHTHSGMSLKRCLILRSIHACTQLYYVDIFATCNIEVLPFIGSVHYYKY